MDMCFVVNLILIYGACLGRPEIIGIQCKSGLVIVALGMSVLDSFYSHKQNTIPPILFSSMPNVKWISENESALWKRILSEKLDNIICNTIRRDATKSEKSLDAFILAYTNENCTNHWANQIRF